jgi:prepilin-type processing-associated H-X9-DG protein
LEAQGPKSRRSPFRRWVLLLVPVLVLVALVFFLGSYWFYRSLDTAATNSCGQNLYRIALALRNYHDTFKTFPPVCICDDQGRPTHSWRVAILPFLDQKELYDQYDFNEPWDGPNNRKLHDVILPVYCCPAAQRFRPSPTTNYFAVVGQETVGMSPAAYRMSATMWYPNRVMRMSDVRDGTSNTVMLVEVADSDVHWMEPRDVRLKYADSREEIKLVPPAGSKHRDGLNVAFGDGSVATLPRELWADAWHRLVTRAGWQPSERELEIERLFDRNSRPY